MALEAKRRAAVDGCVARNGRIAGSGISGA